jgi:hypothetical protein
MRDPAGTLTTIETKLAETAIGTTQEAKVVYANSKELQQICFGLLHQSAAATFNCLLRERAIQLAVLQLAAAGIDFLACERTDQTGVRRYVS